MTQQTTRTITDKYNTLVDQLDHLIDLAFELHQDLRAAGIRDPVTQPFGRGAGNLSSARENFELSSRRLPHFSTNDQTR